MPKLFGWELPFPYMHGPFLYLYIVFVSGQQRYTWRYLIHFIPAIAVAFALALSLPTAVVEHNGLYHLAVEYDLLFTLMETGFVLSGLIYITLSLFLLYRHKRNIVRQFSNTEKINLDWMRYLIWGMGAIWLAIIFARIPAVMFPVITLFIFFIGYFGIRQVGVFTNAPISHEVLLPDTINRYTDWGETQNSAIKVEKIKYEKTRIEDPELNRIHAELRILMENQKCFNDPDLTLGDLAKLLAIPPSSLSQVINSKEGKNFYDYINSFRVETFKQLVLKPENRQYNMVSLAFECGFSSKTSFYRNFKKVTDMSPRDFLKLHKIIADG
ncbi:AraC family transcriptional regulator [Sphingobacterium sp. N143]|uniref:AraC family transcriptional regulator n=1 Tax=Sphingobacterium sp. N143 TaxID=2746727 RepID=UPI0025755ACC|nr:helix-turn-helix domain-containing protein [Sphingobacterium sp. N143]MDM1293090.1 AraC family transcriptional regulator [Sphingobacterium sp. N143]